MDTRSISLRHGGETRFGPVLAGELADVGVVLHDRRVPHAVGCIDHLVVAPSGIWIVDVEHMTGTVEVRHAGRWTTRDPRLLVDKRNRTELVHRLGWQTAAVHAVTQRIGCGHLPIEPALCFTRAVWSSPTPPPQVRGVHIASTTRLVEQIRRSGPIDPQLVDLIARELDSKLASAV